MTGTEDTTGTGLDRRTTLRAVAAGALAASAGCLGSLTGDGDATNGGGNDGDGGGGDGDGGGTPTRTASTSKRTIDRVYASGLKLVVDLTASPNADAIQIVDPTGTIVAEQDVTGGVDQVSFELGTEYATGEWTVYARRNDEDVQQASVALEPDLEIVEADVGTNAPSWPGGDGQPPEAGLYFVVENTGTGPVAVDGVGFEGTLPHTATWDQWIKSGIWNTTDGEGTYVSVPLGVGERKRLYTYRGPFRDADDFRCGQRGEFTLTLHTLFDRTYSRTFQVRYEGQSSTGNYRASECEKVVSPVES